MIESHLDNTMILDGEPQLANFYATGQTSWDNFRNEAWRKLLNDFIVSKYDIRKLCKRYQLQDSVTKTTAFSGTLTTNEDYLNRGRWVVIVSAITISQGGSATFTIKGKNDSSDTYTTITTQNFTAATTKTTTIYGTHSAPYMFKYYAVDLSLTSASSVTYESYLIEDIYTLLHLYLTRALIYFHLRNKNEIYTQKYETYIAMYNDLLAMGNFPYDADDSGTITEDEAEDSAEEVIFSA